MAAEKKVAKKLSKKRKTAEPAAEGSEAPKKKKLKAKALEESGRGHGGSLQAVSEGSVCMIFLMVV